jgi:hypothetical protein
VAAIELGHSIVITGPGTLDKFAVLVAHLFGEVQTVY